MITHSLAILCMQFHSHTCDVSSASFKHHQAVPQHVTTSIHTSPVRISHYNEIKMPVNIISNQIKTIYDRECNECLYYLSIQCSQQTHTDTHADTLN